jgi:hypothetical protein
MSVPEPGPGLKRYCFVDEAGDPVLFARNGRINVGRSACPKFLADPYFKGLPSFDPQRRRTAVHFYAKDDSPEV